MARRKVLLRCGVLCSVVFSSTAFASGINKPASAVIDHAVGDDRDLERSAISKSRVVPLKRKMDLASGELKTKSSSQPDVVSKSHKPDQAESGRQNKKSQSVRSDAEAIAADVKKVSVNPKDEETWDSASTRYDQADPAKSVTKGVRVEDIIEPTFDYRYSSARRKNPFIPEVILTGKAARQRELSPNDVEIPIVSPLQSFPVARLAVIGVWETDSGIWKALIKTPATQGIEAKLGDPIGNSGGRLMTINPDSVVVREFSVRSDGTREYRDIPMYMGSELPSVGQDQVGGRLILRPGATQPEVLPPQASLSGPTDSVITVAPQAVRGDIPGTLKTIESVPAMQASGGVPPGISANEIPPVQGGVGDQAVNPQSQSAYASPNATGVPPAEAKPNEPMNKGVDLEQGTPAMGGQQ